MKHFFIAGFILMSVNSSYAQSGLKVTTSLRAIQGRWVQIDDPKTVIVIQNNIWREFYARKVVDIFKFKLSHYDCDSIMKDGRIYIYQTRIKDNLKLCGELIDVTKNRMELANEGNGIVNAFKKVKFRK